jgi:hypothetical protein
MKSLQLPFFTELEGARTVLVAGAGGGFDVFSGLRAAGSALGKRAGRRAADDERGLPCSRFSRSGQGGPRCR